MNWTILNGVKSGKHQCIKSSLGVVNWEIEFFISRVRIASYFDGG